MLYHLSHPSQPIFFSLVIFQVGSHIFAGVILDCDPPTYASHIAWILGVCHHTQIVD
jgi:hypothetical protein